MGSMTGGLAWYVFFFGGLALALSVIAYRQREDRFMGWFLGGAALLNWWMAAPTLLRVGRIVYQAVHGY